MLAFRGAVNFVNICYVCNESDFRREQERARFSGPIRAATTLNVGLGNGDEIRFGCAVIYE